MLMVLLGEEAARKICEHLPPGSTARARPGDPDWEHSRRKRPRKFCRNISGWLPPRKIRWRAADRILPHNFLVKRSATKQSRPLVEQVRSIGTTSEEFRGYSESRSGADRQGAAAGTSADHRAGSGASERRGIQGRACCCCQEPLRTQAVKRLAEMQNFSPEVVQKISAVLQRKLVDSRANRTAAPTEASTAVADLLNRSDAKVTTDLSRELKRKTRVLRPPSATRCSRSRISSKCPKPGCANCSPRWTRRFWPRRSKARPRICRDHFSNACPPAPWKC